ncbi:MAG: germination protein YpeB [Oscillospiraceae bacterium]|nr:germination protein YpeB [Oscillospiraceae bacterium]
MRRKKILTVAASYAAALIIILSGFVYKNRAQADFYRRSVENNYQHAFAELVFSVDSLDSALQKSLYAASPSMVSAVCTEIYGRAEAAVTAMGELPFGSNELEHTAAFLSKIGDYAFSLSHSAALGKNCSDEELENLAALSECTSALSKNLTDLYAQLNDGTITMQRLDRSGDAVSDSEDSIVPTSLADSFREIESDFPETPTLVYDGPFSAHIAGLKPKSLDGMELVSKSQAAENAAEFLNISPDELEFSGTRRDELPVYIFSADNGRGSSRIVEVTVQGGKILTLAGSRDGGEAAMADGEAAKIAAKFLKERGYESMTETYRYAANDAVTVSYVYEQDGVLCYPDLIKVRVAKDNGEITGFDSRGYIMNHIMRELPDITVSAEDARAKISAKLNVLTQGMAVIPTSGKNEKFCHEFKCENEAGRHYIVYINPETGDEESILILIENENGTLAM